MTPPSRRPRTPRPSAPALRDLAPPVVTLLLALAVLVQLSWAYLAVTDADRLHPRDVPAVVAAGDPVVAEAIARQYDGLPGHPFALRSVDTADQARAAVEEGDARLAILVDPDQPRDTLYLAPDSSPALASAVTDQVREIARSLGRDLAVQTAPAQTSTGDVGPSARLAVVLTCVTGFGLAVVASLLFGPVARDRRRGALRTLAVGSAAVVLGGAVGAITLGGTPAATLLGGLLAATAAATTVALEALFGWAGLGLAVATFFATAVPVLTGLDRYLVDEPWRTLGDVGLPGAGLDAAKTAAVSAELNLGALARVLVWLASAMLLVWVSRAVRARRSIPADAVSRSHAGATSWRLRVVALVAPLTAALVAVAVLVPDRQVAGASARPLLAATTECVSTGAVRDVDDLNRIASLRGTDQFRGGDVGASAQLQDDRRVWLFGDTLQDGRMGTRFVRNSMLLTDDECIQAVVPGGGGALIPDRSGDGGRPVGYWPMSTVVVPRAGYDLLYVTTQRVRTTGTEAFDFENLGLSVAVFVVPVGQTPQLIEQRDIGPDRTGREHPTWGAATTLAGSGDDRWLYVFGTANPGTDQAFGYSLRVARVRPDDLLEPGRWRYWDGSGWSAQESAARELIAARDGVSQTLSVFERDGRWYALSKRNEFLGSDITVWSADSPTGPWSGGAAVRRIDDGPSSQLRYMPLAHPELFPQQGTVVASYSTNETDLQRVTADPRRYRPHFVRVDLPD